MLFSTMFCSSCFIETLHEDGEGILIESVDGGKPRELTHSVDDGGGGGGSTKPLQLNSHQEKKPKTYNLAEVNVQFVIWIKNNNNNN